MRAAHPNFSPIHNAARLCLCIPTYNNPETVEDVIVGCLRHCNIPILVIDDGSTLPVAEFLKSPEAKAALREQRLEIHRHSANEGKGAALTRAFQIGSEQGFTHILTIDADGQHFPEDLPPIIEAFAANPDALVIGARRMNSANSPALSRFGRAVSNAWICLATGTYVADTQSGFRLYPLLPLRGCLLWGQHYDFEFEVLLKLLWKNIPCVSVSIGVHYPRPEERVSHFRVFADNLRIARLSLQVCAWHFGQKLSRLVKAQASSTP